MPTREEIYASGEILATDLNNELIAKIKKNLTPKQIKEAQQLKESREKLKEHNKNAGIYKRKLTWKLKNPELSESERERLSNLRENPPAQFQKVPLSTIDNAIDRLTKKDFVYKVRDDFGKVLEIKQSTLLKKDNPAQFILAKYKNRIKKQIEKAEDEGEETKLYGLNKLLSKTEKNLDAIKRGYVIEDDEEKWRYVEIEENDIELFEKRLDEWRKKGAIVEDTKVDMDENEFFALIKVKDTPDYLPVSIVGEIIDIG